MTLRLDADTLRRLDKLASTTDRSKASLAAQAVKDYLDLNEWQTKAISEAVKRADQPNAKFFDHEEVEAWLATWGTPRNVPLSGDHPLARRGPRRLESIRNYISEYNPQATIDVAHPRRC